MFTCKECKSTENEKQKGRAICVECFARYSTARHKKWRAKKAGKPIKCNIEDKASRRAKPTSIIRQDITETGARECALLSAKYLSMPL